MLNSNSEIKKFVTSAFLGLMILISTLSICCCHSASATKGGGPLQKTNSSENKIPRSNSFTALHPLDRSDDSDSSSSSTTSSSSDDFSDSDEFDPDEFMLFQRMIWTALAEKFPDVPFSSEQDEDFDNINAQNEDTPSDTNNGTNTNDSDSDDSSDGDDSPTKPPLLSAVPFLPTFAYLDDNDCTIC